MPATRAEAEEPALPCSVSVHREQEVRAVNDLADAAAEQDCATVGRPSWIDVVQQVSRETPEPGAVRIHDEDRERSTDIEGECEAPTVRRPSRVCQLERGQGSLGRGDHPATTSVRVCNRKP